MTALAIAANGNRGRAWVATGDELLALDLKGEARRKIPVRARSLCIEPDTRCLWAAGKQGIFQINPAGECVWAKE